MARARVYQPLTVLTRGELTYVREYAHLLTHVAISEEVIRVILLLAHVKATDICTKLPTGLDLSELAGLQRLIKVQEGLIADNNEIKQKLDEVGSVNEQGGELTSLDITRRNLILEALNKRLEGTGYSVGRLAPKTWRALHYNHKTHVTSKKCTICGMWYPLEDYALETSSNTHIKSGCKHCRNKLNKSKTQITE